MSKEAMRQAMPITASVVDEYRDWIEKVVYASENGRVIDRREPVSEEQVFQIPAGYCKPFQPKERK